MWRLLLLLALAAAHNDTEDCVIDLQCAECVPDHMPVVSGRAVRGAGGGLRLPAGAPLRLACPGGRFLLRPHLDALDAHCRAGRYLLHGERHPTPLLDLGCQEDPFEDTLHKMADCGHQGRAYSGAGGGRHLAALCFDSDRGVALAALTARSGLRLPPHDHGAAPLTLLGNFGHMFDAHTRAEAERLFGDEAGATRRLRELLRHEDVTLAGQSLRTARLLSPLYFDVQDARVAEFASNKFLAWSSVAEGNLAHLQQDAAARLAAGGALLVSGTHGAAAVRAGGGRRALALKAGGRFPVPQYVWTVLVEGERALALVVLNDPFVAVAEVSERVFCASRCSSVRWLRRLTLNANFETPLLGLVFCCDVHSFAEKVPELPKRLIANVSRGDDGILYS